MTKSQAINYLCSLGINGERIREVVKALEQEPCAMPHLEPDNCGNYVVMQEPKTDGDYISRQSAIDIEELQHRFGSEVAFVVEDMIKGTDKRWSYSEKLNKCDDCISRQAAIDAIRRIGMCKCSTNEIEAIDECRRAVEALPFFTAEPKAEQEPCEDCISKEKVIDILDYWYDSDSDGYTQAAKSINDLPSVNPQEPKTDNRVKTELNEVKSELKQEPCEDCISRAEAVRIASGYCHWANVADELKKLPSVQPKTDVFNKMIAEMIELIVRHNCPIELDNGNDAWYCEAVKQCIEIIDKYRQEG